MRETRAGCLLVIALVSCGDRVIELDRVCVRAQLLPIAPDMITRSGRTLSAWAGWRVGQIELDGSVTTVAALEIDLAPTYLGRLEHDPVSGRMWLLAWAWDESSWLYQFDAAGQVEWADELVDFAGPVAAGGSLLYHDDSIVFAVTVEQDEIRSLVIERRDLAGETLWTPADIPTPDGGNLFHSAELIGVSDDALSMIATPPLIDYGPSFPLTLDIATGVPIWSGADGHDPLRMIVDDEQLFLAWTKGPRYDPEKLPYEQVEIEQASSSLGRTTPSGEQLTQDDVEWPKGWRSGWDDDNLALAWMGQRVVTLVEGSEHYGVTVHAKDGTLECQGRLDVEIDGISGWAIGIEGREQWLVEVDVAVGEPDEYGDYHFERRVLLLEPL